MHIEQLVTLISASRYNNCLYHFTDEANFNSISLNGLLSKAAMQQRGCWPQAPGGNALSHSLDRNCGIFDDISLCMTQNHPMKFIVHNDGRQANPRYLAIKAEVLRTPGARVAFGIANANGTEIVSLEDAIARLDLAVVYNWTDWRDLTIQTRLRAAERVEILIPKHIPVNMILKAL